MDDGFEVYGEEDLVLPNKIKEGLESLKSMARENIRLVNWMSGEVKKQEEGEKDKGYTKTVNGLNFARSRGVDGDAAILTAYLIGMQNEMICLKGVIKDEMVKEEIDTLIAEFGESVEFMKLASEVD